MKENIAATSLISLDLIGIIITDLNKEILYKIGEYTEIKSDSKFLFLQTDGENHKIFFLNEVIWDSYLEKKYENISPEIEMTLNERPKFEAHLRKLINNELNVYRNLEI